MKDRYGWLTRDPGRNMILVYFLFLFAFIVACVFLWYRYPDAWHLQQRVCPCSCENVQQKSSLAFKEPLYAL